MNSFWTWRKTLGLLAILASIAFADVLFFGKTFYYRDFGVLGIPTTFYARHSFWNGEIPLWNPYSNCGAPFLAQWGTMCLYPLSLIYLVLPFPWSLNVFCVLHLVMGGYGTYKLARLWSGHEFGATLAAVIFTFNGLTLACLAWPNYCVAIGWMPWVLLYVQRGTKDGGSAVLKAIVVAALQLLAGVPELVLLTWIAVIPMVLMDRAAEVAKVVGRLALMVFAVAGACAAQLLPFLELFVNSQRASGVVADKWSLPASALLDFVIPFFRVFKTPQGTYFQYGQHFLSSIYIGGLVLTLVMAGLILIRNRSGKMWAAIAITGIVIAIGMPVSSMARYPVKALLVLPCVFSIIAAIGFRALSARPERCDFLIRISAISFIAVTIGGLIWMRVQPLPYDRWQETLVNSSLRGLFLFAGLGALWAILKHKSARVNRMGELGLIALLFLDFRFAIPNQNPTIASKFFVPGLAQQRGQKLPSLGEGRIFITPKAEDELLMTSVADPKAEIIGKRAAEWSHLNLLDLVSKVNGSSTLQIAEQAGVQNKLYSTNVSNDLLDFLGVTAQISPDDLFTLQSRASAKPLIAGEGVTIKDVSFTSQRVAFTAQCDSAATVVIAQSYDRNWAARVDGQDAGLLRVQEAFQAVKVPSGSHLVELKYEPGSFRNGCAISLTALAGLLVAGVRMKRGQAVPAP